MASVWSDGAVGEVRLVVAANAAGWRVQFYWTVPVGGMAYECASVCAEADGWLVVLPDAQGRGW